MAQRVSGKQSEEVDGWPARLRATREAGPASRYAAKPWESRAAGAGGLQPAVCVLTLSCASLVAALPAACVCVSASPAACAAGDALGSVKDGHHCVPAAATVTADMSPPGAAGFFHAGLATAGGGGGGGAVTGT